MRRTLLLAAIALTFMSTASAQTVEDRLAKARTEVNETENAAGRALYAVQHGNTVKATQEINNTQNAASRALYAIDKALAAVKPTTPTPTPTPAPITCPDGSQIPAGTMCPAPPPPPPVDQPDPDPAKGLKPIASNFDISLAVKKSGVPGLQPTDLTAAGAPKEVQGAFRFICGPAQLSYDDPIVYPGQPGKSHLHQYYGNTGADANSTFASLRASGSSTCNILAAPNQDKAANRSAYWMPGMFDGKGNVVLPEYVQVYYKREPKAYPAGTPLAAKLPQTACTTAGICVSIPNGVKFISGFNMLTGKPGAQKGHFKCVAPDGNAVISADQGDMVGLEAKCVVGGFLAASVASPKCWNGQIDSPDHMSHFAEMIGAPKKCPSTHPYLTPQFTITSFYRILAGDALTQWSLSSDAMYLNLPRGSTLHFDYFEAWDGIVKAMWIQNCIEEYRNGSAGSLCNGQALPGADSGSIRIAGQTIQHRQPIPANPHAMH